MRNASCCCGQLSVAVEGDPIRISVCHCLACQQRTGSVFGAQARFLRDNTTIHGISKEYTRIADSGNPITFHFCPECGSTVYYFLPLIYPDCIAITVGSFADPTFPAPVFSVYEARKHAWVSVPEGAEHWD
jgi:hypothetical protein